MTMADVAADCFISAQAKLDPRVREDDDSSDVSLKTVILAHAGIQVLLSR